MYVKIYNEDDQTHEMYECESYRLFPVFGEDIPDQTKRTFEFSAGVAISMIRDGSEFCIVKDKPVHIYVMNERGKTIDSYDFYDEEDSGGLPVIVKTNWSEDELAKLEMAKTVVG